MHEKKYGRYECDENGACNFREYPEWVNDNNVEVVNAIGYALFIIGLVAISALLSWI